MPTDARLPSTLRTLIVCKCPDWWFPLDRRELFERVRSLPRGDRGAFAHHESCPKLPWPLPGWFQLNAYVLYNNARRAKIVNISPRDETFHVVYLGSSHGITYQADPNLPWQRFAFHEIWGQFKPLLSMWDRLESS